jgi:hypothetical protein
VTAVVRGVVVAVAALLWGAVPGFALTPGGGPVATDCLTEFGGTAANVPAGRARDIRCVDGDPSCDLDPTPGTCSVAVDVCLNVTDPGCAPQAIEDYVVENPQPDTNGRHDFDFQVLQDRVSFLVLPLAPTDVDVCAGSVLMNVPLEVRLGFGGIRYRAGKKVLRTVATTAGGGFDADRMRISCRPADGSTPCDGVTSTFDEIRRHVFTSTSCARSTCHNVAQPPHEMSLSPADAYASLVGGTPTNGVAAAAGKKRVDPGNVANSFIVQKLRGQLAPGEGVQMPFGLTPLREPVIQLIEQWIAAGAPETRFVATLGCH